jgi:hypothetical protein
MKNPPFLSSTLILVPHFPRVASAPISPCPLPFPPRKKILAKPNGYILGYLNLLHLLIYKDFYALSLLPIPHPLLPENQTKEIIKEITREIYTYPSSSTVPVFIIISLKALLTSQKPPKKTHLCLHHHPLRYYFLLLPLFLYLVLPLPFPNLLAFPLAFVLGSFVKLIPTFFRKSKIGFIFAPSKTNFFVLIYSFV